MSFAILWVSSSVSLGCLSLNTICSRTMVNTCWVKDCTNRADNSVKSSLYTIPVVSKFEGEQTKTLSEERRRTWLANINRKDLPSKHSKICSDHFIQGKLTDLYNQSHPDWAPTFELCNLSSPLKSKKKIKTVETDMERYKRLQHRQKTSEEHDIANALLDLQHFRDSSLAQAKSQLSNIDIEHSRKIAHLRIRVELAIGMVRNKYIMLQGKLPIDFLMNYKGGIPVADKIVSVEGCITNMCESVVPFN